MKNIVRLLFLLSFFLAHSCADAQDLTIIFTKYSPPYVFENDTGIVVEIVRTALEADGYKIKPVYVPIGRGFKMFSDKQVDGTTIIQENAGLQAYYSDDFMQYHNLAFALKSRNFDIRSIADLRGKSIISFQRADVSLGEEFRQIATRNPKYKEMAQQEAQVKVLLLGRTDIAVMDVSIFHYYRQQLITEGKADKSQEYVGFEIFSPTPYKAAFKDPQIRDAFNKGIAAMRKDGRYEAIYRKYNGKYFPIRE
ncbi:MAG TPA: transporter substrate-binding domain-containing protein [Methylophilaceae bacterium]|nr:transporter substrate-binding domain-containing protein [Methylophilaceae bacterium]